MAHQHHHGEHDHGHNHGHSAHGHDTGDGMRGRSVHSWLAEAPAVLIAVSPSCPGDAIFA
jgi:hypothetical protein